MKLASGFIGLLIAATSLADIQLAWQPSPTVGVTNYIVYASEYALEEDFTGSAWLDWKDTAAWFDSGTNLTATISDLPTGIWTFVATAQIQEGVESMPSNTLVVEVPAPPTNLRTVVLQYGVTVTNFQDTGFFKVRFQ